MEFGLWTSCFATPSTTRESLAAVSEPTKRVLELARLDKVFTMHKSVDDGLAS